MAQHNVRPPVGPPSYTQRDVDALFDKGEGDYFNESDFDLEGLPRQFDLHLAEMSDGMVLVFDEGVPHEVKDFNSDWILLFHRPTKFYAYDDQAGYPTALYEAVVQKLIAH